MKSWILALSVVVMAAGLAPMSVDAKRLGGGGMSGMQRSLPSRSTPQAVPAKPVQAAPATAPAPTGATPAATPKRSWMGPIAGLAAGLGIAALMSHFGMGAEMGNILMMMLLAGVAFVAIRFVMARMAANAAPRPMNASNGMPFAAAGSTAGTGSAYGSGWNVQPVAPPVATPPSMQQNFAQPPTVPVDFDQAGFERIAKMIFIRMQAANDSADLADLRRFTTPEMYASVKLDLQERGSTTQQTDVVRVDAEVLDFSAEAERQVVSVRFHGQIKEEAAGPINPFDEVWHLVKPNGDSGEWAIAGIQQTN